MKTLGKRVVMVAMVFGMTTAMAQKGGEHEKLTPQQKSEKMAHRMAKKLDLDDKQQASIQAMSLKQIEERQVIKQEMKAVRAKMKVQKKKHHTEIKTVLTPEQAVKFDELKAKRMEKRKMHKQKMHKIEMAK